MESPEAFVIVLNVFVLFVAFTFVYPKFAGANGFKLAKYDLMLSALALIVAGSVFWGTGQRFNTVITDLNWFWFTLVTYAVIELPAMLWYFRKHKVWESLQA